jgi:hypothetical protein
VGATLLVERIYGCANELVRFHENSKIKTYHASDFATSLTGSEVERIGLEKDKDASQEFDAVPFPNISTGFQTFC